MQRGPSGKDRRLHEKTQIRVGKSTKQLRPNERIQLRKDAV